MKYHSILIIFIFCLTGLSRISAQSDTTFEFTYGGAGVDLFRSIAVTSDSGIVATGSTSSFSLPNSAIYFVKTDSLGKTIWAKALGNGSTISAGYSIKESFDKGIVLFGYTNSDSNNYNMYLIKTDRNGNILWSKTYGGSDWDFGYSMVQLPDSGFALCGETYSFSSKSGPDLYVVRTDKNGNMLWQNYYGGDSSDIGNSIIYTNDNNLAVTGTTNSFGKGENDVYFLKINLITGDTLFTRTYGDSLNETGNCIIQTFDSSYVIAGSEESFYDSTANNHGAQQNYLLKINGKGNPVWPGGVQGQHWGSKAGPDEANCVIQLAGNKLLITGQTQNGGGGGDVLANLTDQNGNICWACTSGSASYGGAQPDLGSCCTISKTNQYLIGGYTMSFGEGDKDGWIIRADSLKSGASEFVVNKIADSSLIPVPSGIIPVFNNQENHISLFPNPFHSNVTVRFQRQYLGNYLNMGIYDLSGKLVSSDYFRLASESLTINRGNMANGTYLLKITFQNGENQSGLFTVN